MMARDLDKVVERIVDAIPGGVRREVCICLRGRLDRLPYSAPESENEGRRWEEVCAILRRFLPEYPIEEWEKKVDRIIRGEE